MMLLIALFGLLLVSPTLARFGVDLSVSTDESTWKCLIENNVSFGIVRVYRNLGSVDFNSAASIVAASNAGLSQIDGYIFPCITSSAYSISKNILCPSAEQQVEDTLTYLYSNKIDTADEKNEFSTRIGKIYLDIEDESPPKYFDADSAVNQEFIASMVTSLEAKGVRVGIYTTKTYWANIMGNNMSYGAYPLWYPRYDGVNSFDFFQPFAAWDELLIKQTAGDAPLCSLSQVDTDYMED